MRRAFPGHSKTLILSGILVLCAAACSKDPPPKVAASKPAVAATDDDELDRWEAERAAKKAKREAASEKEGFALAGGAPAKKVQQPAVALTPEDLQLRAKLADFSDALHRCVPQVRHANTLYRDWVDAEKGPTGEEDLITGVALVPGADDCIVALGRGIDKRTPTPALDAAAESAKTALTRLDPLVKSAHEYYDTKAYLTDRMAKGKQMHENLLTTLDAWFAAVLELRAEMDKADATLSERELSAVIEKFGRQHKYLFRTWQYRCRRLAEVVSDIDRTSEGLQATVGPCRVAIEELQGIDPERASPINDVDLPKWHNLLTDLKALHDDTKVMAQLLLDNKPLPDDGPGSPAHFATLYKKAESTAVPLLIYL